MRGKRFGVALLTLALLAVGCRNQQTGVAAADYEKQRAEIIARRQASKQSGPTQQVSQRSGQPPAAAPRTGLGSGIIEATYDPSGKRDPFRSFVLDRLKELANRTKGPLEQFDVGQLTLHGVVWETNRPRALVADPSGQVYIVREGDPIGTNQGSVVSIDDNLMKVRETYVDHMGEPTTKETDMRVRRNQEG
jgi:type IV pilus assembly protein PilP